MSNAETPLRFLYKNWKGNTRERTVQPISVWYGKTEYHPEDQWFLKATDVEEGDEQRDFALKDIEQFL